MNWKVLVAGLAVVLPLVWVLGSGFGKDPQYIPSPLIDKPAPDFTLPMLDGNGESVHLAAWRGALDRVSLRAPDDARRVEAERDGCGLGRRRGLHGGLGRRRSGREHRPQ